MRHVTGAVISGNSIAAGTAKSIAVGVANVDGNEVIFITRIKA